MSRGSAYANNNPARCEGCGTHRAATWTVFTAKDEALRGTFCRACAEREIQRENAYVPAQVAHEEVKG